MKTSHIHNLIYSSIIIVLLILMYALSPRNHYQPRGIFLSSVQQHYSASKETRIFRSMPNNYHKIGVVKVTLYSGNNAPTHQGEDLVVYTALQMVAKNGGAGLVIQQMYFLPEEKYGKVSAGYHLLANVIRQSKLV